MTDIPAPLILNFVIFLSFPFLFAFLAKKIKISPVVGYIFSGLLLGNLFEGVFSREIVNSFAYFGIILLLFTVGLEINFSRLLTLKKIIVIGGTLQMLLTLITTGVLSLFFGFSLLQSFLVGIAFSSSSTALVAKIIQDRGEENSFIGEITLGILMYQDIAFIPFLIIFTSITAQSTAFLNVFKEIFFSLVKSSFIIFTLFYFGQKIIPRVFDKVARTSRELLNLLIIVFIFIVTYLSLILNIPILIGVFVAGILVAQTLEHHHIFSQVRPLRDILAVIFFVFIGLNIRLGLIASDLPKILFFSLLVMLVKALVILMIFLCFHFHSKTASALALYLFQIDEDAFILMSAAFANGVVGEREYLFVISTLLLTLILTPIFIQNRDRIYSQIRSFIKNYLPFLDSFIKYRVDRDQSPIDVLNIKRHIVICGYGRVGSYIGRSLMLANIPFIAVDYNFNIVERAKREGVNIIYGDPSDIDILDYVEIDEALILILAVPDKNTQEAIILNAKKLNPKIFIISRIHKEADKRRLRDLGVDLVVQPEFEASLSIIKKIYLWNKLSKQEAFNKIKRLKLEYGLS